MIRDFCCDCLNVTIRGLPESDQSKNGFVRNVSTHTADPNQSYLLDLMNNAQLIRLSNDGLNVVSVLVIPIVDLPLSCFTSTATPIPVGQTPGWQLVGLLLCQLSKGDLFETHASARGYRGRCLRQFRFAGLLLLSLFPF